MFITMERRGLRLSTLVRAVPDEPLSLASITASELLVGVQRADTSARRRRRAEFVESILVTVPVVSFDLRVARVHARLLVELAAAGQPIGASDLLIGATALAHGSAVLTENLRDFQRVAGLVVRQPSW